MPISNMDRSRTSRTPTSGSSSSSSTQQRSTGGISNMRRGTTRDEDDDPNKDLDARIGNAESRLNQSGIDVPEVDTHKGLFTRVLETLNYLNNKKNQGIQSLITGEPFRDAPEQVTGTDIVNLLGGAGDGPLGALSDKIFGANSSAPSFNALETFGVNQEGWRDNAYGFLFDLGTDPLNFLSFGSAGAANATVQTAGKVISKGAKAAGVKALPSGLRNGEGALRLGPGGAVAPKGSIPTIPPVMREVVRNPGGVYAQLGGHIPFTDIGGYVTIPGSEALLSTIGKGITATGRGIANASNQYTPAVSNVANKTKDLLGGWLIRGYGAPQAVSNITQTTSELIRMDSQDIVNQMLGFRKIWDEGGTYNPKVDDIEIIKGIEDPAQLAGMNPTQQGIAEQVKNFFDFHYLKAKDAGVIDDFVANYIPHIFKGKKKDIQAAMDTLRRRGIRLPSTTPHAKERNFQQTLAAIMKDPELVKKLQPETNLIRIMASYKLSLEKAIRNNDMIGELVGLGPDTIIKAKDNIFDPVTKKWTTVDNEIPDGWVQNPVSQLKGYYVPPEVSDHLKDAMEPFINNRVFHKSLKLYDSVLGYWKGMATVPNLGFHIRNGIGNLWNNYIGGVRNAKHYRRAIAVQQADDTTMDDFYDLNRYFAGRDEFFGEGISGPPSTWVDNFAGNPSLSNATGINPRVQAMERVFNENRFQARFFEGDGPRFPVNWNGKTHQVNATGMRFLAKFWGVTGRGYFGSDLGDDIMKQLDNRNTFQKYNPLSTKSMYFKAMEKGGNAVDDNTRIAHFAAKLEEGKSLEESARSVKKYLFDYGHLTASERNVMKRVMPFYAFTRNNLPLQIAELIKQPKYASVLGKYQNAMNIYTEEVTGEEVDPDTLPAFIKNLYSVNLPFQVAGRDVTAGIDIPIRDLNSMSFKETMSMLTPALMIPFEQVFNRNLYSGRDIEQFEGQTIRAPGYIQGIFRGINALEDNDPEVGKLNDLMKIFGFTVAANEDGDGYEVRMPPRLAHGLSQLVFLKNTGKLVDFALGESYDPFSTSSFLTGISGVSTTADQRDLTSQYQQLSVLEDLMSKMRDEGNPVPTLDELKQQQSPTTGRSRSGGIGQMRR